MDYLIDKKFWNLVINKLSPSIALRLISGLKNQSIKKDFILTLPSETIELGFFKSQCIAEITWRSDMNGFHAHFFEIADIEKAILKVLVETKGLSEKIKYQSNTVFKDGYLQNIQNEPEYIIEQYEPISTVEKGFVYLIRNADIYKIGITDNLLRRFNQLKPSEILNVVRCSNYETLEKELHNKFKEYRIPQTEYFRLDKYQVEQVNIEMTKGAKF